MPRPITCSHKSGSRVLFAVSLNSLSTFNHWLPKNVYYWTGYVWIRQFGFYFWQLPGNSFHCYPYCYLCPPDCVYKNKPCVVNALANNSLMWNSLLQVVMTANFMANKRNNDPFESICEALH